MSIRTVDDGMELYPTDRAEVALHPPAEWLPRLTARNRGRQWAVPLGVADHTVTAEVNAGRWIVECPQCPNAMWATPRDPRFLCDLCENAAHGGRWLHVEFPDDKAREEAERVLSVRLPANQNWNPRTETVVDLMGQNVTNDLVPFEGY